MTVVALGALFLVATDAGGTPTNTRTVDITPAGGEVQSYYVWGNGHFHLMQVKQHRYAVEDARGHIQGERVVEDAADFQAQADKMRAAEGPMDPAKANLAPSQAQLDEIDAIIGKLPPVPGSPPRVMTAPQL